MPPTPPEPLEENSTPATTYATLDPEDEQAAKKLANLRSKIAGLEARIEETRRQQEEAAAKLKDPDASKTVRNHIKLLHAYNEIRDIGTGLMGIIADNRGVQMKTVYEDFGLGEKD